MNKLFTIIFILLTINSLCLGLSQEKTGDSALKAAEFKKALKIYRNILKEDNAASPALLVKMASCASALRNYPAEIYYLNLCYQIEPSKNLQEKIRLLANQYNLEGYNFSDIDLLLQFYYQFDDWVVFVGIIIGLIIIFFMLRRRILKNRLVYFPLIFIVFILGITIANNIQTLNQKAIIAYNNTILMEGPSSASEYITKVSQGHRVTITDRSDVWYKVTWLNKAAYIHSKNLLLLPR
jgi:tetratricopeptide (TPR) repeat protein